MSVRGYNHNFSYRGRLFHIQTEDYGAPRGYIFSHLFVAGRVIKSVRTEYPPQAELERDPSALKRTMLSAHRSMFTRLKAGEFDVYLDEPVIKVAPSSEDFSNKCVSGEIRIDPPANDVPSKGAAPLRVGSTNAAAALRSQDALLPPPLEKRRPTARTPLPTAKQAPAAAASPLVSALHQLHAQTPGIEALVCFDMGTLELQFLRDSGLELRTKLGALQELAQHQERSLTEQGHDPRVSQTLTQSSAHWQLMQPLGPSHLLFLVVNRKKGNLAMTRHLLGKVLRDIPE